MPIVGPVGCNPAAVHPKTGEDAHRGNAAAMKQRDRSAADRTLNGLRGEPGPQPNRPHSLQHTFLTTALDAGVAHGRARRGIRRRPSTTMRYDRRRRSLDRHDTSIVAPSTPAPPAPAEHPLGLGDVDPSGRPAPPAPAEHPLGLGDVDPSGRPAPPAVLGPASVERCELFGGSPARAGVPRLAWPAFDRHLGMVRSPGPVLPRGARIGQRRVRLAVSSDGGRRARCWVRLSSRPGAPGSLVGSPSDVVS